jgi:hypothetical protein
MAISPAWGARLLYAFLIAQTDRDAHRIPQESFHGALADLFERLKTALGGMTRIRPVEAIGETTGWGTEPTTVVLVLADQVEERTADSIIAEEARRLRLDLFQDEVWVTKQSLQLYVAREAR